ncbi:uncharacterized protein LOC111707505 [Eurytemora carolleeae]|uniref:uncharacterized protein LOC111707505 n=1 Tax=Eurytemora carolleeae TaxID=1294199 RepID=UPI000C7782C7|nr:uncharacterized protein LOC111707505 [Eurytemora carolleeae]|eukprot:XP_023336380.1 uncharacterized protein LOC111707505 [Eurytemora affinis]
MQDKPIPPYPTTRSSRPGPSRDSEPQVFISEERRQFYSRAMIKTTLLSVTIVVIFLVTNLPYIIHEFFIYGILNIHWCTENWCLLMKGIFGISIVSNSALNPFIFLLFHSGSSRLDSCTSRCFPGSSLISTRVQGFRVQFSVLRRNQDSITVMESEHNQTPI